MSLFVNSPLSLAKYPSLPTMWVCDLTARTFQNSLSPSLSLSLSKSFSQYSAFRVDDDFDATMSLKMECPKVRLIYNFSPLTIIRCKYLRTCSHILERIDSTILTYKRYFSGWSHSFFIQRASRIRRCSIFTNLHFRRCQPTKMAKVILSAGKLATAKLFRNNGEAMPKHWDATVEIPFCLKFIKVQQSFVKRNWTNPLYKQKLRSSENFRMVGALENWTPNTCSCMKNG